jgi:hypothetical protein
VPEVFGWVVFAALTVLRLGWLIMRLRQRRQAVLWIVTPVAFVGLLAVVTPITELDPSPPSTAREALTSARSDMGFDRLPNLNRAELRLTLGASGHLDGVDLRGVDWPHAHLRGKTLRFADLRLADLRHADLRNADLRGAVLMGSLLNGADLRRADLRSAVVNCANLWGADLRGAKLAGTHGLYTASTDEATRWPARPPAELPTVDPAEVTWRPWCVHR